MCLASLWTAIDLRFFSLLPEHAHQAVAQQWMSALAPLFRLSSIIPQYIYFSVVAIIN
jgi:hypothetical protein